METLAYGVGVVAAMIALWIALTGYGTPRDRMVRFAIPSPLFVGAPICGVVLRYNQDMNVVVSIANLAVVTAAVALCSLVVLVVAATRTGQPH